MQRLLTTPAVGERVALMVYAWVGDARRFRNARELGSYAGLVPSVRQSGEKQTLGGITKMGSPQLRSVLVQAGHVLLWRCQSEESAPLKAIAERVQTARARRKIAVIAAARHILRIAYYVMRDGITYRELGADYSQRRDRERTVRRHVKQLEALGYVVTMQPAA